jgi:hypothetical protein
MAELLKFLPTGPIELKDVLYFCIIGFILFWQKIGAAQRAHCPSHKYLIDGLANLEKQVKWGNKSITKIAIKNNIELGPEPE